MKQQLSALLLGTALSFAVAGGAFAQDKTIKIGVLTDNSGLYSDLGGAGSTVAAQMAIEDSGMAGKGWKIDMISADHQNKPDIGTSIARQAALQAEAPTHRAARGLPGRHQPAQSAETGQQALPALGTDAGYAFQR